MNKSSLNYLLFCYSLGNFIKRVYIIMFIRSFFYEKVATQEFVHCYSVLFSLLLVNYVIILNGKQSRLELQTH